MLIDRRLGSFTFLGALVIDAELPADAPHVTSHCGTCTRCLDACPTDAFKGPYQLDARRCISYWTIEHKGPIDEEIAGRLDGWVFGCDVCQDVCPWNRKAPPGRMPELEEHRQEAFPNLVEWLARDDDAWRTALKGTALSRAKRAGLLRNAAIVAGGQADPRALPRLEQLAADEREDPGVREAAAWAVARINAGPPD
jgi:epoxyqueuosine reductase